MEITSTDFQELTYIYPTSLCFRLSLFKAAQKSKKKKWETLWRGYCLSLNNFSLLAQESIPFQPSLSLSVSISSHRADFRTWYTLIDSSHWVSWERKIPPFPFAKMETISAQGERRRALHLLTTLQGFGCRLCARRPHWSFTHSLQPFSIRAWHSYQPLFEKKRPCSFFTGFQIPHKTPIQRGSLSWPFPADRTAADNAVRLIRVTTMLGGTNDSKALWNTNTSKKHLGCLPH